MLVKVSTVTVVNTVAVSSYSVCVNIPVVTSLTVLVTMLEASCVVVVKVDVTDVRSAAVVMVSRLENIRTVVDSLVATSVLICVVVLGSVRVVTVKANMVLRRVRVFVSSRVTVISVVPLNEHVLVNKLVMVTKPLWMVEVIK